MKKMPKKGQPDFYWKSKLQEYAQGRFHFKTGQKPGNKKWKAELQKINGCPRHGGGQCDINGNYIHCVCGYHKVLFDINFIKS